jgi:polyphosphate kinase 2 (PPK2 family)
MNYSELFRVKPGSRVNLDDMDPNFTAKHINQKSALRKLEKYTQQLRDLQHLLYAEGQRSLLICLQGLDTSGKDGSINHVLGAMNPQGTRVHVSRPPPGKKRPTISYGALSSRRRLRARWLFSTARTTKTFWWFESTTLFRRKFGRSVMI